MHRLNKTRWSVKPTKGNPVFMLLGKVHDEKYINYRTGYNMIYFNHKDIHIHSTILDLLGPIRWGEFQIAQEVHAFTKDKAWNYSFIYDNQRIIDTVMWDGDKLIGMFYASLKGIITDPYDLSGLTHMGDFEMERIE